MPPVPVADIAVRGLLQRWFPGQDVAFERIGVGVSTPVYRVVVGAEVTYLRLAEQPGERRDAEVRVHSLVRELGVMVPEVLRYEANPPEVDRSATLTSAMPGVSLTEFRGDARPALEMAGRELARINAIPVRGWGWVRAVAADGGLVAEHTARASWVTEHRAAAERVIGAGHTPSSLRAAISTWAGWPRGGTSALAHGDLDSTHIYVDPITGTCQGFIDFGEIRGAEPCFDLGHLLVVEPEHYPHAATGYGPVDHDAVRLQAIAIATRALAIQLDRTDRDWRDYLANRAIELLGD